MARCGQWRVVAEELRPHGKVLPDPKYRARAKTRALAPAADLRGRRIGGCEKSHRPKMRRLRHAWRFPGACGGKNCRYEREARKIRARAHAVRCGRLRLYP